MGKAVCKYLWQKLLIPLKHVKFHFDIEYELKFFSINLFEFTNGSKKILNNTIIILHLLLFFNQTKQSEIEESH